MLTRPYVLLKVKNNINMTRSSVVTILSDGSKNVFLIVVLVKMLLKNAFIFKRCLFKLAH